MTKVGGRANATSAIKEEDLYAIMRDYPTLGAYGFGTFGQYHPEYRGNLVAELKESRAQLFGSVGQCSNICEWLYPVAKSKTINKRHTSYGLKHYVERCYEQSCSNGAFIAAAIYLGFDGMEVGPSACFNFEQASLDELLITNN